MDDKTATQLAGWAEHEMTIAPNSSTALRGAAAAQFGRATIEGALVGAPSIDEPHVPAEPDAGIAAVLERVRRAIGEYEGDGRDVTPGDLPCP